jgi:hypothetical protein
MGFEEGIRPDACWLLNKSLTGPDFLLDLALDQRAEDIQDRSRKSVRLEGKRRPCACH